MFVSCVWHLCEDGTINKLWPYRNVPFAGGDSSVGEIRGSHNKENLLFSGPEMLLECSSQSANGFTPQGDNSFLF